MEATANTGESESGKWGEEMQVQNVKPATAPE